MNQYAIRTDNLTCDFGAVRAVDGLSIEVPAGSVFGFLGPNGAGKTTTIRLLLGLLEPTAGRAEVLGCNTRTQGDEIRLHAGALLEHNGLYERLSAEDNLEFYGMVWRLPAAKRRSRIQELLTHLGLWERRKDLVGTWSRGMKQKLAVARTLLHQPSLVFLDEPTAGLDPVAAVALRDDLGSLARQAGVTVFLTTHNLVEAERLCQQVAVIRQGMLMAIGTVDALRRNGRASQMEISGRGFSEQVLSLLRRRPEVNEVSLDGERLTLKLKEESDTSWLVSLLVGAGVQIDEVRKSQASLEEVFLTLMEEEQP